MIKKILGWRNDSLELAKIRREQEYQKLVIDRLREELVQVGVIVPGAHALKTTVDGHTVWGDITTDIGASLLVAELTGIRLARGVTYSLVQAYLSEDRFAGVNFNNWFSTEGYPGHNYAGIHESTVQVAVCRCLLLCVEAGLIPRERFNDPHEKQYLKTL